MKYDDERKVETVLKQLVHREVVYCASSLVYALGQAVGRHGDLCEELTDDDVRQLQQQERPKADVCFDHGYRTKETADGYIWWDSGDVEPFVDVPRGMSIKAVPAGKFVTFCTGLAVPYSDPVLGERVFETAEAYVRTDAPGLEYCSYHAALTAMWDDHLRAGSYDYDVFDSWEAAITRLWQLEGLDYYDSEDDAVDACFDAERLDPEYNDAYEHWIVTDYFGRKLAARGEIVHEIAGLTIWGRCCAGQAIYADGVIRDIASDMEILPGQRYSWADKDG